MRCGKMTLVITYQNPRKRGKPSFTLSGEHLTEAEVQNTIKVLDIDPLDQYELTYTTHECDVH